MSSNKISVLFGDKRQKYVADYLRKKGLDVLCVEKANDADKIKDSDAVIFPVPMTKDGINVFSDTAETVSIKNVAEMLSDGQKIICAKPSSELRNAVSGKDIRIYDPTTDDLFLYENAIFTAQGTLSLLLSSIEESLKRKKCLIVGCGRVGEALAKILKGVGCDVYIGARNPLQLKRAEFLLECKTVTLEDIPNTIHLFDFIFGTVPENILDMPMISHIKKDALYFELASQPYTANPDYFAEFNKQYIPASALPGRYTPISAGRLIAESAYRYITKR